MSVFNAIHTEGSKVTANQYRFLALSLVHRDFSESFVDTVSH